MRDAAPLILAEPAPAPAPASAPQAFPADAPAANAAAARPASEVSGEAESARAYAEDDRESLDTITVTGTRLAKQRGALPAWTEDVLLEPDAWLERIRERVREGDRQGAEHSLRRFVLKHRQTQQKLAIELPHGSLLVMAGATQRHYRHALPRTTKPAGERINLTFRRIRPPQGPLA